MYNKETTTTTVIIIMIINRSKYSPHKQSEFTTVERFWTFCDLPQGNAENISANVISCLNRGVQSIVREACPNAHYAHCCVHQLNLVLQQATSQIDSVRVFFAHLNPFP